MDLSKREKALAALLLIGVLIVGVYGVMSPVNSYEKFEMDSLNDDTERVVAECTCYGSLLVAESYPPQYHCKGYEMCTPVNYTRPR